MAQLNKTDEFFSGKLQNMEIQPLESSWDQVQKRIGTKKVSRFGWLAKVAAAILLLLTATVLFLTVPKQKKTLLIGVTDHPTEEKTISPTIPQERVLAVLTQEEKASKPTETITKPLIAKETKLEKTANDTPLEILAIERIALAQVEIESKPILPEIKLESKENSKNTAKEAVKITYIATSDNPESGHAAGKLNRMLTAAQNVSPAELLADLRDAKDNLLSRN